MTKIQSSAISAYNYDPTTQKLTIDWKSGSRHAYESVPADVVERLKTAESVGKFVNENIVPKYSGKSVDVISG